MNYPKKGNVGYSLNAVWGNFVKDSNQKTDIVSNWNPNWQNEYEYPNPDKALIIQWAWEFLRRNSNYQNDYLNIDTFYIHNNLREKDMYNVNKLHFYQMLMAICNKYNTTGIADPEEPHGAGILTILGFQDSKYPNCYFYDGYGNFLEIEPTLQSEVSMTFNVSLPINPQILKAKNILNNQYKTLLKKGVINKNDNSRLRVDTYRDYLRIYDARLLKIPYNKIAEVIYPNTENSPPDFLAKKKVEAAYKAAKNMVYEGYKIISSKIPKYYQK